MTGDINKDAAAKTGALLADVWKRNLPMLRERLAILDRAVLSANAGHLSRGLRDEAAATSHKLAGSLGMFGHHDGTRIARELESLFEDPYGTDSVRVAVLVSDLRRSLSL